MSGLRGPLLQRDLDARMPRGVPRSRSPRAGSPEADFHKAPRNRAGGPSQRPLYQDARVLQCERSLGVPFGLRTHPSNLIRIIPA